MNITNVISRVISAKHYRPILLALALFVGVAAPLVAGSSANAAEGGCAAGRVCLYEHKDYGGSSISIIAQPNTCYYLEFFNNKASSVVNYTSKKIKYMDSLSCSGRNLNDDPGGFRKDLAWDVWTDDFLGSPNDKISSFFIY